MKAPLPGSVRLIGLDLDNTVIDYSTAYRQVARSVGLPPNVTTRKGVRDLLRRSSTDDDEWQRFQSVLYTTGLDAATPAPGLDQLAEVCRRRGIGVSIISHKTAQGPERFGSPDLRRPARAWMRKHGLFDFLLSESDVTFHATAKAKVAQIAAVQPTIFVDDLREILNRPGFPRTTMPVLYQENSLWRFQDDGLWSAGFPAISQWVDK